MYCMMSTFATDDKIEEEVESRLDAIDESEYDDMLDECTPMIVIGTLEYSPSQVLKAVDEVAYELGFSEYVDSRREDIEAEVRAEYESQSDDD
jgi:hypothetical protein